MVLTSAYQEIPKQSLVELLDTVRNRTLNMALEIKTEIGSRDEDLRRMSPNDFDKVDQTIINNIYGGQVYVSTGYSSMSIEQTNIGVGDWDRLKTVLLSSGMSELETTSLSGFITHEPKRSEEHTSELQS